MIVGHIKPHMRFMNTLKLILLGILLCFALLAKSQVQVNVNIGSPPLWGPVGYVEERYYYLPDIEVYYDIQTSMFIYFGNGVWVHRTYLPSYYSNYDLYGGYKVVLTGYHGNSPYANFHNHKMQYKKGYHGKPQKNIGSNPGRGNSNSGGNRMPNNKSGNINYGSNNSGSNKSTMRRQSTSGGKGPGSGGNKVDGGNNGSHGGGGSGSHGGGNGSHGGGNGGGHGKK